MKNLDKTIIMASLTVAGLLGINMSAKANNQVRDSSGNYYNGPATNATTTATSSMVHNSQERVSMNDAAAPKTRQQVMSELVEARKNGLLNDAENNYPQKWIDYQNHKSYGNPYHK